MSFAFSDWALAIEHRVTNSPFTMHSQDVKLEHKLVNQVGVAPKRKVQIFSLNPSASGAAKLGTMYVMFANEQN